MIFNLINNQVIKRYQKDAFLIMFMFSIIYVVNESFVKRDEPQAIQIAAALLPPNIDIEGNGREIQILEKVFSKAFPGKKLTVHVFAFGRHWREFIADERFHAVTTVPLNLTLGFYRTQPYINYLNTVAYLKPDNEEDKIRDFEGLSGKRIVSFAGAQSILSEVKTNQSSFSAYMERSDQRSHSIMLNNRLADAAIADLLIFKHYTKEVFEIPDSEVGQKVEFFFPFCPTPYAMVFRNAELRNKFDQILELSADEIKEVDKKFGMDINKLVLPKNCSEAL